MSNTKTTLLLPLALGIALLLVACAEKAPEHSQVSAQPPISDEIASIETVRQSRFATRARISYQDLAALAEAEVPAEHKGDGAKKICKRTLGIKLCGNAKWNYTVQREGAVSVAGENDFVLISVPMRFFGNAGIRGDVAKLLNLDALDFSGAMNVQLRMKFDLAENWCPLIETDMQYTWTKEPRLEWTAGMGMNLKDQLDKAIRKQMGGLQERAQNAIDCDAFRETIQTQWRKQSIALDLPQTDTLYLNIEPTAFAFSGIKTEEDKLGLAFTLDAETIVQPQPVTAQTLALPIVSRTEYQAGTTHFTILIRAAYSQLEVAATERLVGETFTETSPAGDVSVTIERVAISGNPDGLTINLGFNADLPGSKYATPGDVYLTAQPVVDAFTQKVRLDNIALSNVLDSALWNTLAAVFNKKIIAEIEKEAVFEIGPHMTKLSDVLQQQLSDPDRTGGLNIDATSVNVYLDSLVPEKDTIAARLNVEAQLDIAVPFQALSRDNNTSASD